VTVTTSAGTATTTAVLSAVLPGLFTFGNYVAAIRPGDSTIVNGTGNAITGYSTAAAANPGDVLSLYATGLAATTTSVAPGLVFSAAYPTSATPTVTIGGIAAAVSFSGLVGAGLYQINLTVPATLDLRRLSGCCQREWEQFAREGVSDGGIRGRNSHYTGYLRKVGHRRHQRHADGYGCRLVGYGQRFFLRRRKPSRDLGAEFRRSYAGNLGAHYRPAYRERNLRWKQHPFRLYVTGGHDNDNFFERHRRRHDAYFFRHVAAALTIDSTSLWNVTANSTVTSLIDKSGISGTSITNIVGNGYTVTYNATLSANSYFGGLTYSLANGGSLIPAGSVTTSAPEITSGE